MRKIYLLFAISLLINGLTTGQINIAFHENFELPSQSDSLISSQVASPGISDWGINTRIQASGSQSDSCQVKVGKVCFLTSIPFNTLGQNYVELHFDQICKVNFFDTATIEVSNNGGLSWMRITSSNYLGTGSYGSNFNRFNSASYGNLWLPLTSSALPQNTWWKHETFDISAYLANSAQAMIRFRLADGGPAGPNANAGWFLDNINLNCAFSEMTPPLISWVTPFPPQVFQSSGIPVKAVITDGSGMDTAMVVYTVNGGIPDTLGMFPGQADTLLATFPLFNDTDEICFFIRAVDASPSLNVALMPETSCVSVHVYTAIIPHFYDDFETAEYWIPTGIGGTTWEKGIPNFGQTNSTHFGTQAWDVNLNSGYESFADCKLYSPVFDFSGIQNATLSFWVNYHTESNCDGLRMEYSTNGIAWQVLGTLNDPNGTNWYNSLVTFPTQNPVWSGTSNGWKKVKYKLNGPGFNSSYLRFRLIFTSNSLIHYSGFSIDDFLINTEGGHEIGLEAIILPVTGCNAGINPLTIMIKNSGSDTISDEISAGFQIQNGTIYNEIILNTIPPGTNQYFTFQTPVMLMHGTGDSTFLVKAWVKYPNDPDPSDDTLVSAVISKFIPPSPLVTTTNTIYGGQASLFAASTYPVRWFTGPAVGTTLRNNPTYITPNLYQTTVFYVSSLAPSGCFSPRVPDTVVVAGQPQTDMALTYLYKPLTSPALTASEIVKIRIRNLGSQPIPGLSASYKLDNEPTVTESIPFVINPGDTLLYTFTQTVNLENMQYYHIKTWVSTPGDTVFQNDTLKRTLTHSDFVYCTANPQSTLNLDIGNFFLNNINNGNASPQIQNPLAIGSYSNFTQSILPIILAKGQSYPISITPIFTDTAYFNCVRVFADWNHNGIFEYPAEIAFTSGPIQSGSHTGTLSVPINAVTAYTRLRVILLQTHDPSTIFPCNEYTWGETEDYMAYVYAPGLIDAGLSEIKKPGKVVSQNSVVPCIVKITNFGSIPVQQMNIGYTIDTLPPVIQSWNGFLPSSQQIEISLTPFTPDSGYHSLCVFTELAGDTNHSNDQVCKTFLATQLTSLPYTNTFDSLSFDDFTPSGTTGTAWIHGSPSPGNFPFQGAFTTPGIWATNLNLSGYTNNALCYLTSPIFDFSSAFNAKIQFRYTMNTQLNVDGVRLEYTDNGGTTWLQLGGLNDPLGINWNPAMLANQGPGWTGTEPDWKKSTYLLSNLNQTSGIQFRIVFSSNSYSTFQGFALDDFSVSIPCQKDIALDSIIQPSGAGIPSYQPWPVSLKIRNNGTDTLMMVSLSYQVNEGPLVTEILSLLQGLMPEESRLYTFNTPTLIPVGQFTLKAWLSVSGDCSMANDSLSLSCKGIPVFIAPYTTNFDSMGEEVWSTAGSLWELGTPNSSQIDSAYSAPNCWKTNLDGHYPVCNQPEYLYSPYFLGSGFLDSLTFIHRYHIHENDFARVEYLSTSGWRVLGFSNDPNAINWYNSIYGFNLISPSSTWISSGYNLKIHQDFANPTRFRFLFYGLNTNQLWDGWAMDDFQVTSELPTVDAGIGGIQQPFWICQAGDSLHVQIFVKNYGADTLHEIPVKYSINGIIQAEELFVNSLIHGQSVAFEFAQTLHIPGSNFVFKVFTDMPDEQNRNNDTLTSMIQVIGEDELILYDPQFRIIPTPCKTTCQVQINLTKPELLNISFIDITGKLMLTREISGQYGLNTLEFDVSGLSPGSYICRAETGGALYFHKFVVIH